ncbi:Zinc finger protein 599 [Acromyrmex echinatior]|uniref:Zinc finger protein 599 n=1 Tax=Acromyrmex echinatior TaxID=103372 RepID=F4WYJ5_ACREC|nr:Zinc finger protein 599 [Acromyrmex echinatior]
MNRNWVVMFCFMQRKNLISVSFVKKHLHTDHPERKYKCNECPSTFTHQRTFNAHINIIHKSSKSHVCKVCGKGFRTKHHKASHSLVHSNKKFFECSECGKGFKHRNTFINHNNDTSDDTCKTNEEQTVQRIMAILNEAVQQSDETET